MPLSICPRRYLSFQPSDMGVDAHVPHTGSLRPSSPISGCVPHQAKSGAALDIRAFMERQSNNTVKV